MPPQQAALGSSFRCLRCSSLLTRTVGSLTSHSFSTQRALLQNVQEGASSQVEQAQPPHANPDPQRSFLQNEEKRLLENGAMPIGSRRRRAAIATGGDLPFQQLPYQCFQEARKILQTDREDKLRLIEVERQRIARVEAQEPYPGTSAQKQLRLQSMRKHLEYLKIQADINDPMVKKRFEDGKGDMNKPVYRHLADRKWRSYRRLLILQRITQMHVIPDILPHIDPIVDVGIFFGRRAAHPGDFVPSTLSEEAPRLNIQLFEKGEKLVTVAVVDPDVPVVARDGFMHRCHYLASNIKIAPTSPVVKLGDLDRESQVLQPWMPPFAQKGSPYHRLCVLVFQQPGSDPLDMDVARSKAAQRDDFHLKGFATRLRLTPIGAGLFRAQWDDGTASVMQKAGVEGAEIEWRRERIEPLPYKRKDGSRFR
ncbi:MAG: hypothetical protein M1821_000029 [Bathelium mastoideum]|nr:MAG: hypothetical protein M1821_000029 [Bathelium mastoideum]